MIKRDLKLERLDGERMKRIAKALEAAIEKEYGERRVFALVAFTRDDEVEGNYISNGAFEVVEPAVVRTLFRVKHNKKMVG